ncbi:MAG: carbohydrate kinase family protein [Patescibacteria group bacterium]|jgi:sugar/nucleoside kinase (ribokinase family)
MPNRKKIIVGMKINGEIIATQPEVVIIPGYLFGHKNYVLVAIKLLPGSAWRFLVIPNPPPGKSGLGKPIEVDLSGKINIAAAGSSMNIALIIKALSGIFGSAEVILAGGIDENDQWGRMVVNRLDDTGIRPLWFSRGKDPETPFTLGLTKGAETTLFCWQPPYEISGSLQRNWVEGIVSERPNAVILSSVMEYELETAIQIFQRLGDGVDKVLSLSEALLQNQTRRGDILEAMKLADLVFMNRRELRQLFGQDEEEETDAVAVLRDLAMQVKNERSSTKIWVCVVTLRAKGAAAAIISDPHGAPEIFQQPARKVVVRDKTGAGDAYVAGFVRSWLKKPGNIEQAMNAGAEMSIINVSGKGGNFAASPEGMEMIKAAFERFK